MTTMDSNRPVARRRMLGVFAGAGLALWLAAAPASAQWFGGFEADAPIPPQGVVRMLVGRGFSEVTRPRFDGEVYHFEGTNRFGERVRLTIDAYDGDIVDRTRLAHAGPPVEGSLVPPQNVGRGRSEPQEPLPPSSVQVEKPRTAKLGEPAGQQGPRSEPPVRKSAATRALPPPSEARPVQPRVAPSAPAPAVAAPKPPPPNTSKSTETAATTAAPPVRVIGGVTPLNLDQPGTTKPTTPEPPAATPETPPL